MARRRRGRGASSLFVVFGVLGVLGATFGAGFFAGRHWERVRVLTGLVRPQAAPPAERAPRAPAARPPGAAEPALPSLTFYQELTAPLASLPPRGAKTDARAPAKAESPRKPEAVAKADPPARPEPPAVEATPSPDAARPPGARGYAVQVAAYATREQADALARRLAGRGFGAEVSETETAAGVRYRVRVGSYATKEAARDAARRLATQDPRLAGFVAPR